jgi:hypothetical protein
MKWNCNWHRGAKERAGRDSCMSTSSFTIRRQHTVPLKKITKGFHYLWCLEPETKFKRNPSRNPQVIVSAFNYHTVPLGCANAERSFSAMRWVKSWQLWSTISGNSLNNRIFSTIKKECVDDVCTTKVSRDFVRVNEKRRKYFGQFNVWYI